MATADISKMSYAELAEMQQKIAAKMAEQRAAEISTIAEEVKTRCANTGIKVEEVIAMLSRRAPATNVKYRDPKSGKTWTGRGKRPGWINDAINGGKNLEDFAV